MTFTLPIVGDSSGTWGSILNDTLTDMEGRINTNTSASGTHGTDIADINTDITALDGRVDILEAKPGGLIVGVTGALPPVTIGQITLATDTGYLSYGASISGVATRVPWPGSWVGTLRQTTTQAMAHQSNVKIVFDTMESDRLVGFSTGAKTRYTCQLRGTYEFAGGVSWQSNAVGFRKTNLFYRDGTATSNISSTLPLTGVATSLDVRTTIMKLNVGDWVELGALHTAGVGVNLNTEVSSPGYYPNLSVKYLGHNA